MKKLLEVLKSVLFGKFCPASTILILTGILLAYFGKNNSNLFSTGLILIKIGTAWLVILFAIFFIKYVVLKKGEEYVCPNCYYTGKAVRGKGNNVLLELLLWMLFVIPGFIYCIVKLFSGIVSCPVCQNNDLYLKNSLKGKKLIEEANKKSQN